VREPLLILAVHLREVGHVCDEDLGRFGQHKVDKRNWRALEWHRESQMAEFVIQLQIFTVTLSATNTSRYVWKEGC
jgi:hypothetical protein